jgi:hypothetical protein
VAVSAVAIELQGKLLARDRELDSGEGTIITWEDGFTSFQCALGMVHIEHDASHAQAEAIQHDFSTLTHASSSRSK